MDGVHQAGHQARKAKVSTNPMTVPSRDSFRLHRESLSEPRQALRHDTNKTNPYRQDVPSNAQCRSTFRDLQRSTLYRVLCGGIIVAAFVRASFCAKNVRIAKVALCSADSDLRLGVEGGDTLELRVEAPFRRLEAEGRQPLRVRSPDHFTASQPSGSISNASVSR